ncbi:MAG: sigma-70 family RNA polymerase sigma factor [Hyphomicrobiaceae bacterium]
MSDPTAAFHDKLLEAIPQLRATARALCNDAVKADDIVQDVLLKAWEKQGDLESIDHIVPWLLAILRNTFRASFRRRKFESDMPVDDTFDVVTAADQELSCEVHETLEALAELPADQREVLVLVCFEGMSYEDAAVVCDCPVGTVKSRLNRARRELKQALGLSDNTQLVDRLPLNGSVIFVQSSSSERRYRLSAP